MKAALRPDEVADLLAVSESHVRELVRRGSLSALPITPLRIHGESVERLLSSTREPQQPSQRQPLRLPTLPRALGIPAGQSEVEALRDSERAERKARKQRTH